MQVLQWFVDLGASVMLPIIIFVFALLLRTKGNKAFRAGLTIGIGFIAINLVIGLLGDSLGPAIESMVDQFGLTLHVIDVGWPAAAAISYGTALGSLTIPIGITLNMLLLTIGLTRTLNIDIWNFWHTAFTGSLVFALTDSFAMGIGTIILHHMLLFLLGDWIQKDVQSFYGYNNITFPHGASAPSYIVAKPLNYMFDRIPKFNKLEANEASIQKRLGVLGDSTVMGALLGLLIGILAGYDVKNVLQLAIQMSAVMLLLPRMVALIMEGLTPISEAAGAFVKKHFPGKDLYIGMDSALAVGHPIVLSASLLLVPITLLLAAILPGNKVLPFTDLATIPFLIALMVPVFRGNIVRTIIGGSIYIGIGLYIATWVAPLVTSTAIHAGFDMGSYSNISALVDGAVWTTFPFVWLPNVLHWFSFVFLGAIIVILMIYVNKVRSN
ncbi:PTS galactitol transporter subunit IIC [Virgibacillus pantothenticus]|uniref:PTS galactitol transporter subunit IIC n=1 Tax=Virgibacillus pantothenticus TaxID=1473 RepID=UPI001BAED8F0|nr:PTS transporter subunit IIC [Virgibacillus pantothenticus]